MVAHTSKSRTFLQSSSIAFVFDIPTQSCIFDISLWSLLLLVGLGNNSLDNFIRTLDISSRVFDLLSLLHLILGTWSAHAIPAA